jgi:hypothetical protein
VTGARTARVGHSSEIPARTPAKHFKALFYCKKMILSYAKNKGLFDLGLRKFLITVVHHRSNLTGMVNLGLHRMVLGSLAGYVLPRPPPLQTGR